jgi:hypothetical protein
MRIDQQPQVEPAMLGTLGVLVAIMLLFAAGMYWAAQPTILVNAGLESFHKEMRRSSALTAMTLEREGKRPVRAWADANREGLNGIVRQATDQQAAAVSGSIVR